MKHNQSVESQLESLTNKIENTIEKSKKEHDFAISSNLKFKENLLSFKNYFPDIYDKFLTYVPNEKFKFILNENGTANILDYETGVRMYSDKPVEQALEQVYSNIKKPIIGRTDHSSITSLDNPLDFIHVDLMNSMGKVYAKAKSKLKINSNLDEKLPSLMLFGVGLGYHLDEIIIKRDIGFINIIYIFNISSFVISIE